MVELGLWDKELVFDLSKNVHIPNGGSICGWLCEKHECLMHVQAFEAWGATQSFDAIYVAIYKISSKRGGGERGGYLNEYLGEKSVVWQTWSAFPSLPSPPSAFLFLLSVPEELGELPLWKRLKHWYADVDDMEEEGMLS